MQVVIKSLLYFIVILLSLAIFAPKRELYYLLENYLQRQDIVIDNEKINSGLLTLKIEHPDIYVKGVKIAKADELSIFTIFFYSLLSAKNIDVDESLARLVPGKIEKAVAQYQILNPKNITISIVGDFGKAKGYFSLTKRVLHIDFENLKSPGSLRSMLKKGEKGWYYEASF